MPAPDKAATPDAPAPAPAASSPATTFIEIRPEGDFAFPWGNQIVHFWDRKPVLVDGNQYADLIASDVATFDIRDARGRWVAP